MVSILSLGIMALDNNRCIPLASKGSTMKQQVEQSLTMIYWKGDKFWLGKLLEHPEIMTQGETIEELEENLRDAYISMFLDDVPDEYQIRKLAL
jgi:predicted RNase H-like HicB family nuclease